MRWFERLGAWLAARGRDTVILTRDGGRPYLHRHYITGRVLAGMVSVCLHHFLASDEDFWHDHPWPYLTIILGGGYWELMPDGRRVWRRPGSIMFRSARSAHMVELDPRRGPCWTLFIMGPRVRPREWGFRTSRGWVQWQQYLDLRDKVGLRPKTVGQRPQPRPSAIGMAHRFGDRHEAA